VFLSVFVLEPVFEPVLEPVDGVYNVTLPAASYWLRDTVKSEVWLPLLLEKITFSHFPKKLVEV
jgi:hypothetical protein